MDLARGTEVRSQTKIDQIAQSVTGQCFARFFLYQFYLKMLALFAEILNGFILRNNRGFVTQILGNQFLHPSFDFL